MRISAIGLARSTPWPHFWPGPNVWDASEVWQRLTGEGTQKRPKKPGFWRFPAYFRPAKPLPGVRKTPKALGHQSHLSKTTSRHWGMLHRPQKGQKVAKTGRLIGEFRVPPKSPELPQNIRTHPGHTHVQYEVVWSRPRGSRPNSVTHPTVVHLGSSQILCPRPPMCSW